MKQTTGNKNRKTTPATSHKSGGKFKPEIFADSLEVMELYSMQKLNYLETSLNLLTIADHTQEIISLCHDIRKERKTLLQIGAKRRMAS